jgi:hypothetical protein
MHSQIRPHTTGRTSFLWMTGDKDYRRESRLMALEGRYCGRILRGGGWPEADPQPSLLVDMGAPVSVAQAQLRHEDPSVTLGTYSHVLGDSQREYAGKVAELLDYSGLQKHGPAQLIQ